MFKFASFLIVILSINPQRAMPMRFIKPRGGFFGIFISHIRRTWEMFVSFMALKMHYSSI